MKKIKKHLRLLIVAVLALCMTVLALPTTTFAQASTEIQNEIIPFEQVFPDVGLCNDEPVLLTGSFHVVTVVTEDNRGNSFLYGGFHFRTITNLIDISGVGLVTGKRYQLVGAGPRIVQELGNDDRPFPIINTQSNSLSLISHGNGDNLQIHMTFHTTINANGEVTSFVDNFTIECRG